MRRTMFSEVAYCVQLDSKQPEATTASHLQGESVIRHRAGYVSGEDEAMSLS